MSRISTGLSSDSLHRISMAGSMHVLITGASGYVGQFLIEALCRSREFSVTATCNAHDGFFQHPFAEKAHEVSSIESARTANRRLQDRDQFRPLVMDIADEESIRSCLQTAQPNVVIHCAALSSPAACERDPERARETNCPIKFMNLLKEYSPDACLIYLSTDHVYDGRRKLTTNGYCETSPAFPVNMYGRSKLEFEEWIRQNWSSHVILRSSVIFGPPVSCRKAASKQTTLLQFVTKTLRTEPTLLLFNNERRNFVFIDDVVATIQHFVEKYILEDVRFHHVFNMGGSECLSRVEFGEKICEVFQLNAGKIDGMSRKECKEGWANVCAQPENVSMVSTRLYRELGWEFHDLRSALEKCQRIEEQLMASPLERHMSAFSNPSSDFVDFEELIEID